MKKACSFVAFLWLLVCVPFHSEAQFDERLYTPSPKPRVDVTTFSARMVPDAFRERGKEEGAILYRFSLTYIPLEVKELRTKVGLIVFDLTELTGLTPGSFGELRIVRDLNNDYVRDDTDEVIAKGKVDFASRKISFHPAKETLWPNIIQTYFLEGDFPQLVDGAEIRLKFSDRLLIVREEGNSDPLPVHIFGVPDEVWHREGNSPPELIRFPFLGNLKGKGVSPPAGRSGDLYTFKVFYSDRDGDTPKHIEVWVDLNGDDLYEPKERFPLELSDKMVGVHASATDQRSYHARLQIIPKASGKISYRFFANDGKHDATGEGTEDAEFFSNNAVIFGEPRLGTATVVPGERFDVIYPVRYFFEAAKIDWASIPQSSLGPFRVLQVLHKNPMSVDLEYDEELLVVTLASPVTLSFGNAAVPPLTLTFMWWDAEAKKEVSMISISPRVVIPMVPLRASFHVVPSRAKPTIGDTVALTLTVVKGRRVTLLSHPEKELSVAPFAVREPVRVLTTMIGEAEGTSYSVNFSAIAPVGPGGRWYPFSPYLLEYRLDGEKKTRVFTTAGSGVFLHSMLTPEDLKKLPAVPQRGGLPETFFAPIVTERMIALILAAVLFVMAAVLTLRRPVQFCWSALFRSRRYLLCEARSEWRGALRTIRRASPSRVEPQHIRELEQTFRRYLGHLLGLGEEEARSVLLPERVAADVRLGDGTKEKVRQSLVFLYRFSEDREQDPRARDAFLKLQRELQKELRI